MAIKSKGTYGSLFLKIFFVVLYAIGIIVFLILCYMTVPEPYNWSYENWQHIGIVPIITLLASAALLFYLFKGKNSDKKTLLLSTALLTIIASIIPSLKYTVKNGNIKYDGLLLIFTLVTTWILALLLLALLPFIWKTKTEGISLDKQVSNYVLLTTSVMWLAPLLTETFIGLCWYLNGTYVENLGKGVWGGAGFNDFLFILGLATLLPGLLSVFTLKILNWLTMGHSKLKTKL